jgi:hypothetical protein
VKTLKNIIITTFLENDIIITPTFSLPQGQLRWRFYEGVKIVFISSSESEYAFFSWWDVITSLAVLKVYWGTLTFVFLSNIHESGCVEGLLGYSNIRKS